MHGQENVKIAYRVKFSLSIMGRVLCLTDAYWFFMYLVQRDDTR
jgi:hypothetical protein